MVKDKFCTINFPRGEGNIKYSNKKQVKIINESGRRECLRKLQIKNSKKDNKCSATAFVLCRSGSNVTSQWESGSSKELYADQDPASSKIRLYIFIYEKKFPS